MNEKTDGEILYFRLIRGTERTAGGMRYTVIKRVGLSESPIVALNDLPDSNYYFSPIRKWKNGGAVFGAFLWWFKKTGRTIEQYARLPNTSPPQWKFEKKIILPK